MFTKEIMVPAKAMLFGEYAVLQNFPAVAVSFYNYFFLIRVSISHFEESQEDLNKNQIQSIQGLENLVKLKDLYLSSNKIESIEGLENVTKLIKLYVDNNQIQSLNVIEKFKLDLSPIKSRINSKLRDCIKNDYFDLKKFHHRK